MARTPLAELLRSGRRREHLTQEKLAERSGISRDEIAGIEAGRIKVPGPEIMRPLARTLGIPMRDIVTAIGYIIEDDAEAWASAEERLLDQLAAQIERFRRRPPPPMTQNGS